ncbi:unnamed protein product, partial [Closterium sp. NIES-64]
DELVPLTLVELDYLISKKLDYLITKRRRCAGAVVTKVCGSMKKLDEGDDFLAALNPRTRWEEAAVGDANMRNCSGGTSYSWSARATTSFPPLRFRPPVHTTYSLFHPPPSPPFHSSSHSPFTPPVPLPSPFPPIFQSPHIVHPFPLPRIPLSRPPFRSTLPFPLTHPPPLSNSPYMFPSHSPVIPPSHRQHFQVPLSLLFPSLIPPVPCTTQPAAMCGPINNHEVFELLTDRGAMGAVDVSQGGMGPAAIECQVYTYLCAAPAATQTRAAVAKCTERAATFGLTRMETLQLVNLRPSQPVEAHLIIADCEMRLPGERVEQLLQVVEETLPAAPELEGGAEEEEGG